MSRNRIRLNICGAEFALTSDDSESYIHAIAEEVEAGSTVSLQVSQGPDPSTQAKDVTKTLSVSLPDTGGVAFIQVLADGEVIFSEEVDTTMEMLVEVAVTAKAGESKNMSLYVDGVLQNSWTESFEG